KSYGLTPLIGSPGASDGDQCQINVACPSGTGWENERRSVAIIGGDGSTWSGVLIMNACGTRVPYVLTAKHAYDAVPTVGDWVIQFLYYSSECTTNTGYTEDYQFNGASFKAANAATDFALVRLNQTPPTSIGLYYAGWNRVTSFISSVTILHHPKGDLMKISR